LSLIWHSRIHLRILLLRPSWALLIVRVDILLRRSLSSHIWPLLVELLLLRVTHALLGRVLLGHIGPLLVIELLVRRLIRVLLVRRLIGVLLETWLIGVHVTHLILLLGILLELRTWALAELVLRRLRRRNGLWHLARHLARHLPPRPLLERLLVRLPILTLLLM
jgi:hypothetical protein